MKTIVYTAVMPYFLEVVHAIIRSRIELNSFCAKYYQKKKKKKKTMVMCFFVSRSSFDIQQLLNEAEQDMKNSADRGGCYPQISQLMKNG